MGRSGLAGSLRAQRGPGAVIGELCLFESEEAVRSVSVVCSADVRRTTGAGSQAH